MTKNPKVTIICVTYNHNGFIQDALNGFVMQKTDFPFQVLVGDDASTDGTTQIVKDFAEKYPDIIKPVFHEKNVGAVNNSRDLYSKISSPYVVICEGDDYFTDADKLQKQADFLDTHPECAMCFHPVTVKWEDKSKLDSIFPKPSFRFNKTLLTLDDLLKQNFIQTNSCMYRWRFQANSIFLPSDIAPGDWFIHLLHAQTGKIGFLPDVMAVYRKNAGGIWNGAMSTKPWFERCGLQYLNFLKEKERRFNSDETDSFLLALTLFLQKIDADSPLYNEAKKIYPTEYRQIKTVKYVKIKYLFYSLAKIFSCKNAKQHFKQKKKLYQALSKNKK